MALLRSDLVRRPRRCR